MIIEQLIVDYLRSRLDIPAYLQEPAKVPASYVLVEKTGGSRQEHICTAQLAIQSYGKKMLQAAELNEEVKAAMEDAVELKEVSRVSLNSDYNFTDTETKRFRYQAVFDLVHY